MNLHAKHLAGTVEGLHKNRIAWSERVNPGNPAFEIGPRLREAALLVPEREVRREKPQRGTVRACRVSGKRLIRSAIVPTSLCGGPCAATA